MEPNTTITAAKLAYNIGAAGYRGWGWMWKKIYGTVSISHPQNRDVVAPGWVELSGTHNSPSRGKFWLVTAKDHEYWLHTRIILQPDGRWSNRVHVGTHAGPRTATILLVWVTPFIDDLLADIRIRSNKADYWEPIAMAPDRRQFSVVQAIVLSVGAS